MPVPRRHRTPPARELLYLGDEGLPAGQAEQPAGHELVGLHIHHVEEEEPAASPPRPHADVQVLDAVGREQEGAIRIHLRKQHRELQPPARPPHLRGERPGVQSRPNRSSEPAYPSHRHLIPPTETRRTGFVPGRTGAARGGPAPPQPRDSHSSQALPAETLSFVYGTVMEFLCLLLFTFAITAKKIPKKLLVFRWSH